MVTSEWFDTAALDEINSWMDWADTMFDAMMKMMGALIKESEEFEVRLKALEEKK